MLTGGQASAGNTASEFENFIVVLGDRKRWMLVDHPQMLFMQRA
jgi:hypothetical protein